MSIPLRVLIVEDSEDDTILILRELQKGGYAPVHERVETAESMQKSLQSHSFDLVLSDFSLPQFSGPSALALIHEMGFDLPFILISGAIGEINAVTVMKAGAHDFVAKGNWARLIPAVERELREAESRRMRRQVEERLKLQAFILENMAEGLVVYDERGTILITNHTFDLMFRYETGELIGRHISLLNNLPAEENARLFDEINRQVKLNGAWIGELINTRKDNAQFFTFAHISALESGNKRYFVSAQEDITERKKVQSQVKKRLDRLSALQEIGSSIASFNDLEKTVKMILEHALNLLQADAAVIYVIDPYEKTLEFKQGSSKDGNMGFIRSLKIGKGLAGLAVLERRVVSQADITSDGEGAVEWVNVFGVKITLQVDPYRDFACRFAIPLVNQNQLLGVVEVFIHQPSDFDIEWFSFLEMLARQTAIAFDHYSLLEGMQQSNVSLIFALEEIIESCAKGIDQHCQRTAGYSKRLTESVLRLARQFDLSETEITAIQRGSMLYDLGMILVPESMFQKEAPFTSDEKQTIRRHTGYAYEMMYPIAFLRPSIDIPYCHHENWDGTGYPRGLSGDQIPLAARIFSVIEVWNAMLIDRPYRPAIPLAEVKNYLKQQSGCQFDPKIIEAFLRGNE